MSRPWLLKLRPPTQKNSPPELIWWAVTRQAAHDLVFSYEGNALDALEYLRGTGKWVAIELFGVPSDVYKRGVIDLVATRERRTGTRLSIELLRRNDEAESSEEA